MYFILMLQSPLLLSLPTVRGGNPSLLGEGVGVDVLIVAGEVAERLDGVDQHLQDGRGRLDGLKSAASSNIIDLEQLIKSRTESPLGIILTELHLGNLSGMLTELHQGVGLGLIRLASEETTLLLT